MLLKGKRTVVTGAAGFIGSHLVERLVQEGAHVRAMTHYRGDPNLHNLEHLPPEALNRVEIHRGNIEDPFFVRQAVEGCDVIFHLAALIAIPYSYVAPASYVNTNISGTLNILEACRQNKTGRMIHTSTSECYGTAQYTPIDEQHPLQGQSPYSASKIGADKLVESYYRSFTLPVVTIRPFNTYGPRQSARAVIPTIVSQLVAGNPAVRLGSLTPIRDLTYVTDTVDGFIRAAVTPNIEGELINLGVGKGITIGELAKKIFELFGKEVPIAEEDNRVRPEKSEVFALISDNSKAKKLLDWNPIVSLDNGLKEVIDFVRDHANLYKTSSYQL